MMIAGLSLVCMTTEGQTIDTTGSQPADVRSGWSGHPIADHHQVDTIRGDKIHSTAHLSKITQGILNTTGLLAATMITMGHTTTHRGALVATQQTEEITVHHAAVSGARQGHIEHMAIQ